MYISQLLAQFQNGRYIADSTYQDNVSQRTENVLLCQGIGGRNAALQADGRVGQGLLKGSTLLPPG